jgi:hypothetical protein
MFQLESPFFPSWLPLDYLPHWILSFIIVLVLQRPRQSLSSRAYGITWLLLLAIGILWSYSAVQTFSRLAFTFPVWQRAFTLLPGLVMFSLGARLYSLPTLRFRVPLVLLIILATCAAAAAIDQFDAWTYLFGKLPYGSANFDRSDGLRWYLVQSPRLALLVAVLMTPPRLFMPDGIFPSTAPRIALRRLTDSVDAPQRPAPQERVHQRPLLQISLYDLILTTAVVALALTSHTTHSATAFCYAMSFFGGLVGAKIGVAMSRRRLAFAIGFGIFTAILIGLAAGSYFGLWHNHWPWALELQPNHPEPRAKMLRQLLWVVLPRSSAIGLLAATLYLAVLALYAKAADMRR